MEQVKSGVLSSGDVSCAAVGTYRLPFPPNIKTVMVQ